jgi:hypothetical protein
MIATPKWKRVAGLGIHALIAAIMILAGSAKVLGAFPAEQVQKLGLADWITVIGAGELATAVLLLITRTAPLGVLLASSFWGGAICIHMSTGEPIILQSDLLLLTWVGAGLRLPAMFSTCATCPAPAAEPRGTAVANVFAV